MTILSLYAVFANREEAERIAKTAVEEGLAACVNILGSVHSIYRWDGDMKTAEEVAAIFKTTEQQAGALMTRIADLHSYEVPCLVTWPIDKALGTYASWVEENVA